MPCTNKYNKILCPYCPHRESCKVYKAEEYNDKHSQKKSAEEQDLIEVAKKGKYFI